LSNQIASLEDHNWEIIKSAIADPDHTILSLQQTEALHRITSVARILDRHPQGKAALNIHLAKYPNISRRTASRDIQRARELNVSYHEFNYDFWHNWLINDIVDQIQSSKAKGDLKSWSAGHANLIRAIGERVPDEKDPKLVEKHTFLIQINHLGASVNIDTRDMDTYQPEELKAISDAIYTEISEDDAGEMFKT